MGTIKQSQASKRAWARLTEAQKLKKMQPLIRNRWKGKSKRAKVLQAKKAARARWDKVKLIAV